VSGGRAARLRHLDRLISLLGVLALVRLVTLYGFPDLRIPAAFGFAWSAILPLGFFLEAIFRLLWVDDPWRFIARNPMRYILITMIVLEISGVASWGSTREASTSLLLGQVYLVIFLFGFAGSWAKGALLANRWLSNQRIPVLALPVVSFGLTILAGGALLALPGLHLRPISALDSLFTATSALCVTGLVVYDLGTSLNVAGRFVLAILVQIGGLGTMTVLGWLALWRRGQLTIGERTAFSELVGGASVVQTKRLLGTVLRVTLIIEGLGTLALWLLWRDRIDHALPVGAFHAIMAFCNAGFALFADSFAGFRDDAATLLVVMLLIVAGGAGFSVLADSWRAVRSRTLPWETSAPLAPASRLVLRTSGILVILGTSAFLIDGWIQGNSGSVLEALFQSVATRTAGFQVESQTRFASIGLVATVILMAIGASPQSTGGGIKTTVIARLWRWSGTGPALQRGGEVFWIAARLVAAYVLTGALAAGLLRWTDSLAARDALFESFSALGTVGLSRDLTPHLSPVGKWIVIFLMFAGRVLYPVLVLRWTRTRPIEPDSVPWT
jgi:trk system potassium uptake protein TrkH